MKAVVACALALLAVARPAAADRTEPLPAALEGIGITEKFDAPLPLDLVFRDEEGRDIPLRAHFAGDRPVILNLGYYRCPMLCGLVLNGLVAGVKQLPWTPGQEFTIVTLSIDPTESATLAKLKKQVYIKELGRPSAAPGWHFLTGSQASIAALTDAAGFGFRWNEERQEYAHAAALIVCTPDGRISRYLYGIEFDPQTLRLSLVEAAAGRIGSPLDRILLTCFSYDAHERRYALAAVKLMRIGGVVTILTVGGVLAALWRRDSRSRSAQHDGREAALGTET